MIGNKENRLLLSNKLYYKDWRYNTSGLAEVVVLLELIIILAEKSKYMQNDKIVIGMDYKQAHKKIKREICKSSEYA